MRVHENKQVQESVRINAFADRANDEIAIRK